MSTFDTTMPGLVPSAALCPQHGSCGLCPESKDIYEGPPAHPWSQNFSYPMCYPPTDLQDQPRLCAGP